MAYSNLKIHDLELRLHLGWPENERLKEQTVSLEIDIKFNELPAGCLTDKLEDTFCYSALINAIKNKTRNCHFHLLEHLCHEIYKIVKDTISSTNSVSIRVTKRPSIPGLKGGVTFGCWDGSG